MFRMTFSLSIQSAALVFGATKLATGVARHVGKAIGFDEVLRSGNAPVDPAGKPSAGTDIASATTRLTETVLQKLNEAGLGNNPPASLEITPDGRLQVVGDHPAAAEIEATLAEDPVVRAAVSGLVAAGATVPLAVDLTAAADLTNPVGQANISTRRS